MTDALKNKEGVQTMDPTDIDSPLYRVHKYLAAIQVLIPGHAVIDSVAGMTLTAADLAAVLRAFSEVTKERDQLKEDLSTARQSLYEVAAQRNELHATLEKYSVNAREQ